MSRSVPIRLGIFLLGLWVALAPAVYAMPMAAMMQQTGLAGDADPGDCEGCPDPDEDRALCAQLCMIASVVAVPAEGAHFRAAVHEVHLPTRHLALEDFHLALDPDPPKSLILH